MPNKRQKPADQLQGKGSRYRGTAPLTLVPPDARRTIPPTPPGLSPTWRKAWRAFWSDAISTQLTSADGVDVARYFTLLARREALEEGLYRCDPETGDLDGLTESGSQGQAVIHPHFIAVKEITREIEKLREQLGILPLSRMRLGIATVQHAASIHDLTARLEKRRAATAGPIEAEVVDLEAL